MKNKSSGKQIVNLLITISLIIISLSIFSKIIFAPPQPHSVNGFIFNADGSNVSRNTSYSVNVSNGPDTIFFKRSKTSFPFPGFSGYYSESVSGTDTIDTLFVTAWNNTNYGFTSIILNGAMSGINVTINLSRPPEPLVEIIIPQDNVIKNELSFFNVTANITLIGNASTQCNLTLSFSNNSVLSIYNNPSNQNRTFNNLGLGSQIIVWNITGLTIGSSDIIINFTCIGESLKFELLNNSDILKNITIIDGTPPNISLITPTNNTKTSNSTIMFYYNVTDTNNIANCSFYLNGTFKQINDTITKSETLYFNETIVEGLNLWQIMCTDIYGNTGISKNFSITKDTKIRSIYLEYPSYMQGSIPRFLGYNWSINSLVTITIFNESYQKIFNLTSSNIGVINSSNISKYFINYSDFGNYNISAFEVNYTFYNASGNFSVYNRIQSLFTDKIEYLKNENVTIFGFNFSINATIRIKIFENITNSSYMTNLTIANSSGNFVLKWNLSNTCTGIFRVQAEDLNYSPYNLSAFFNISNNDINCFNWGNSPPNISSINVYQLGFADTGLIYPLVHNTTIICNFSVYDENGVDDILSANATFYISSNKSTDPDNNNTHYTNNSCSLINTDIPLKTKYFECGFSLQNYANNGSWFCNATAYNSQLSANNFDSANITTFVAINLTSLIDFGKIATGDISNETNMSITNFGNTRINLNISAYARTPNDGIAMLCDTGNISLTDLRYDIQSGRNFSLMANNASNTPKTLSNFLLSKQSNNSLSEKNLSWRVRATPLSFGNCNGTIVVTATPG